MTALSHVRAVILDWAGTAVDFGSRAPVDAFITAFAGLDIHISPEDARGPMGRHKRDHLAALFALPHVAAQWQKRYGQMPREVDIDAVYAAFVPAQMDVLSRYATPIPGVIETVATWRSQGVQVGSTTGYTAAMLQIVAASAAAQGYVPDAMWAADQTPAGRPAPWMVWQNLQQLGVYPASAVVKIGDTPADIAEGLSAGCWTIGLTACGNEVGLSEDEWRALAPSARAPLLARAEKRLRDAGAHYLALDWSEVPARMADIDARLAAGDKP